MKSLHFVLNKQKKTKCFKTKFFYIKMAYLNNTESVQAADSVICTISSYIVSLNICKTNPAQQNPVLMPLRSKNRLFIPSPLGP